MRGGKPEIKNLPNRYAQPRRQTMDGAVIPNDETLMSRSRRNLNNVQQAN